MKREYDCIVAGAGLAGFAAAISAARCGASVLLIDKLPCVGGTAVYTITPVISGWGEYDRGEAVAKMLSDKLAEMNALVTRPCGRIITDEVSLQKAMISILSGFEIDTLYNATVCGAERQGDRITSVTVMTNGGLVEYNGKSFVDATGDAVLSRLAGAEILTPDPDESMTKTLMFKVRNVENFDRDTVKAQFNAHVEEFPVRIQNAFMGLPLVDHNEILLNLTAVTGDASNPEDMSKMYTELYSQISPVMEYLRKYVSCFANAVVSKVAPVVGVRYTCSVKGLRKLTIEDMHDPQMPPEPVTYCGSYIGGHYVKQYSSPWGREITGNPAIPYGSIRVDGISNLLTAGRIIDVDPKVISAVRMGAQCLGTGQAAGIAAALGVPEYPELLKELERQGCMTWLK